MKAPKVSKQEASEFDQKDIDDPQACAEYVGCIAGNLLK